MRAGDTLAGIATTLWGDANLWYKIAQANGIAASDSTLVTGTSLRLPPGVVRTTNNASTFRPYDPTDAVGETSPTTPKPQAIARSNKKKCGVFGQILLVAVAVAVVAFSQGTLTGFAQAALGKVAGAVVGGALAGAAGSVASQAFGNATGIQKGFSWKAVALSAVAGGVSGGLGEAGLCGKVVDGTLTKGTIGTTIGNATVRAGVNRVLASTITQGIAVATKLQSRFDFAGVAAAGIGAGVASAVGSRIGLPSGSFGERLATNTAGGIVNAATRSLVDGTSFGDNIMAALPDIIGNTVGGYLANRIAGRNVPRPDSESGSVNNETIDRS